MLSKQAVKVIGCTYRQLDNLTRTGAIAGQAIGSGNRRQWDVDQVIRLTLANHIRCAMPTTNDCASPFPVIAKAALGCRRPPPRTGYAVLLVDPLELLWASNWADLRRAIDLGGAAVVVAYDLDALVGQHVDLDAWACTALRA
jgi:hypothetical protein